MKRIIYQSLYRFMSVLSNYFNNRYLIKYKVLLGTSLLMLTACQLIKKDDRNEDFMSSGSKKDDSSIVLCYEPAMPGPEVSVNSNDLLSEEDENLVFTVVERMPRFPGGDKALINYMQEKIEYPSEALKRGYEGRVLVSFVIEKDGSVSSAEVLRGIVASLDKEALRIIRSMPDWTPGKQRGKTVRVKYTVPVQFRLPK